MRLQTLNKSDIDFKPKFCLDEVNKKITATKESSIFTIQTLYVLRGRMWQKNIVHITKEINDLENKSRHSSVWTKSSKEGKQRGFKNCKVSS